MSGIVVDPNVTAESDPVRYGKVQAAIPMDDDKDDEDKFRNTEHIRKVCPSLRSVKKFRLTVNFK